MLVIWQKATGKQQFLPRQGSAINSISLSSDGLFFAAVLADNSIRIYSTLSMEVERNISGLKSEPPIALPSSPLSTMLIRLFFFSVQTASWKWGIPKLVRPLLGLVVEPRNNLLVLNGDPGGIQFYDALANRYKYFLSRSPLAVIVA